jgi:hypothetical protein
MPVELGLAAELHPARNSPLGAVLNPRPDQLALELTDRGQYLEQRRSDARALASAKRAWGTTKPAFARIPPDQALKLSAYGIPLDWIYDGRMKNLPPHIRGKIRQLTQ